MKTLSVLLLLPICAAMLPAIDADAPKCHSEQFTRAKRQLGRIVLTQAQRSAINSYEATFHRQWRQTHNHRGCTHHEAHASEFIAAASGVLTDAQFKQFRRRDRNALERTQNEVWQTGLYIDNLIKIAGRL